MFNEFEESMGGEGFEPNYKELQDKLYENIDREELHDSILYGCRKILEEGLESYICKDLNIQILGGYFMNIKVSVDKEDVPDMLDKVMNYYIEKELYEKCSEVKELQQMVSSE